MSEINENKIETIAEEAVETAAAQPEAEAQAVQPEEKPAGEKQAKKNKKGAKKRKRAKLALPIVAVLLVIALLFGTVVGYILGRNAGAERLREAELQLAALTEAFEDASTAPAYDVFDEELTEENRSALSELSGASGDESTGNIMGEQEILGAVLEGGEAAEPVVVAEFKGGALMSDEVAREYEDQMAALLFAGYTEEEISPTLLDEVMQYMVANRILEDKARELGLMELTDADKARIEADAQELYDAQVEFFRAYVNTDGMSEEEANGAVKSYLLENEGVSLEGIRAELEGSWWVEKLYAEVTKDAAVTAEDLEHSYEHLVQDQKAAFEAYPADYEYAQMSGEAIAWNLDGYRAVRMLLFAFENAEDYETVLALSDELAELDEKKDAELIAETTAQIDACYAAVEAEARDALAKLEGGAEFDQLLQTIGDDDGMKNSAHLRERGYYVSEASQLWPGEFISAAMALENAGDISGAVRVADGVCILQYVGDVPAGQVPLAEVQDQLEASVLESVRYSAYEQQVEAWLQEAEAKYYPERMQ